MSKGQKVVTTALWGLLVVAMLALIASGTGARRAAMQRAATTEPTVVQPAIPDFFMPDFSLTDETGRPFTRADLSGAVAIADFIFTRCPGPCPMMTSQLAALQKRLPPSVRFVSFTMDPQHDTPAVLRDYAARFHADPARWHFLTGDRAQIVNVAKELKLPTAVGQTPADIVHSEKFVLVTPDGRSAGYYDSTDPQAVDRLVNDATALAATAPATHRAANAPPQPTASPAPSPSARENAK
jgi:protein SCO1/2